MQLQDLQALKEIPGYTAILKAVLKSQIQLLVEQLCDQTGEESIILTASISDGTLCHLGSNRGKNFLDGREELKSEFLNHCLKVEEPQPKRLTRRHQTSPAKKKPATVTSPTFTSEFQEKLFSSRVHLNPISDAGTKAENTVFKLNIPGDDVETVHVSLNDDDDDDNDTDNYLDSFEQSENSSHDVKSKRSKRKHHKGGRKCALEKKRKSNENEAEMFDGSQIKTENIKDEEQDLEITGFEMGGNSKWTAGLGNSSLAVDAENDKREGSNQSAMNSILEETDDGFKLKLTRVKLSKCDSQVPKHPPQTSNTATLEFAHAPEEEDPDEPPILKPSGTQKFSNEAYEKNFKSFIQEKDAGRVITSPESASTSAPSTITSETDVQHHGYSVRMTYPCAYCTKTYSTLGSLRRHEDIHIDGGPFLCRKCKRSFVNKKGLDTHYLYTDHDKS